MKLIELRAEYVVRIFEDRDNYLCPDSNSKAAISACKKFVLAPSQSGGIAVFGIEESVFIEKLENPKSSALFSEVSWQSKGDKIAAIDVNGIMKVWH